ncbi:MAG: hypothetical protein KGD63_05955 [Candidatus Lokiarchaeota archaeon]|nr:hypothetical protein [Candidatus Lokiarchaeota archaeon]
MVNKTQKNKNIIEIYECPKCHKQYKTLGWYKRHCLTKHIGILPFIKKFIIKERDLQTIIMDTMKEVLKDMDFKTSNKNADFERAKRDHQERIKMVSNAKNGNVNDFNNVIAELNTYFIENNAMVM